MLKLAETVECWNLFRLTLAHLQWLSRWLLLVEGSAQKSLKLSPRVSFPPRLAHLDQFKPIFETWLTTPAGTSIWMAEPPLSAPAPPCQHNKFQYFRKTPRISWRGNFFNRWINVWRGNRRPHKYPSWTDLTRRVIDYQMAGKRDCHQPTLIRALTNDSRYTHGYSSLLILTHIKFSLFLMAQITAWIHLLNRESSYRRNRKHLIYSSYSFVFLFCGRNAISVKFLKNSLKNPKIHSMLMFWWRTVLVWNVNPKEKIYWLQDL